MLESKELGGWLRDNEALLYKMVWARMHRMGQSPNSDDVKEIVSDAMWRMWEYRDGYKGGNLKSWISSVVASSCVDVLRERGRQYKRDAHYVNELGYERTTPSPEARYVFRETVQDGLAALTPQVQRIVWLSFFGYDYQEIADEVGLTWTQVKNALARGRQKTRAVEQQQKGLT